MHCMSVGKCCQKWHEVFHYYFPEDNAAIDSFLPCTFHKYIHKFPKITLRQLRLVFYKVSLKMNKNLHLYLCSRLLFPLLSKKKFILGRFTFFFSLQQRSHVSGLWRRQYLSLSRSQRVIGSSPSCRPKNSNVGGMRGVEGHFESNAEVPFSRAPDPWTASWRQLTHSDICVWVLLCVCVCSSYVQCKNRNFPSVGLIKSSKDQPWTVLMSGINRH